MDTFLSQTHVYTPLLSKWSRWFSKRSKNVPTKTIIYVGMVHCVAEIMGSCMENQLVGKIQEQGGVFYDIITTQVNIHQLQDS